MYLLMWGIVCLLWISEYDDYHHRQPVSLSIATPWGRLNWLRPKPRVPNVLIFSLSWPNMEIQLRSITLRYYDLSILIDCYTPGSLRPPMVLMGMPSFAIGCFTVTVNGLSLICSPSTLTVWHVSDVILWWLVCIWSHTKFLSVLFTLPFTVVASLQDMSSQDACGIGLSHSLPSWSTTWRVAVVSSPIAAISSPLPVAWQV